MFTAESGRSVVPCATHSGGVGRRSRCGQSVGGSACKSGRTGNPHPCDAVARALPCAWAACCGLRAVQWRIISYEEAQGLRDGKDWSCSKLRWERPEGRQVLADIFSGLRDAGRWTICRGTMCQRLVARAWAWAADGAAQPAKRLNTCTHTGPRCLMRATGRREHLKQ